MGTDNKKIILVVDDSPLICHQIRTALKEEPFIIVEVHTGAEAVDAVEQYQPDLILLDVMLPDKQGFEVIEDLKKYDKNNAMIVFLTSQDKDEDVERGFSKGACDYIKKPFVRKELCSRVRAHLALKARQDDLARQNRELQCNLEKISSMAVRDDLTGLLNRRYVLGDLVEEIQIDGTAGEIVFVMVDIDDFKRINDTYGHDAGDAALVCLATILKDLYGKHRVIRWGGEEFLIVLLGETVESATRLCEEIRREIEAFEIFHDGVSFFMTITMGMQIYWEASGVESAIQCADKALYWGKRSGKNCCIWFEEKMR